MRSKPIAGILALGALVAWSSNSAAAPRASAVKPRASHGCGAGSVKQGEKEFTLVSGGKKRSYFRYIPRAYDGHTPIPLILDLHGTTEGAGLHKISSALGPFGNKHGFITITPQGTGVPVQWDTHSGSFDMKFLIQVLDKLEQTLCIDERRVFVSGYSNGAMVASVMACDYADRIAAVAPVAGIRAVPGCAPSRPVPVVAFHGVADEWIAFNGGLGPGVFRLPPSQSQKLVEIAAPTDSGLSIPGVAAAWAQRNGCDATPTQESVASDVTLVRYTCPNHADVELYEIAGAGHTWPGSKYFKAIEQYVGKTTYSIDADAIMWKFFQQHPLRSRG